MFSFRDHTFKSYHEFAWAQELDARGFDWSYESTTFRDGAQSYTPDFQIDRIFLEIKVDRARNVHNRFHLCEPALLLIFGLPRQCYIRFKPAGMADFLPGRFRTFDFAYAYALSRKVAA